MQRFEEKGIICCDDGHDHDDHDHDHDHDHDKRGKSKGTKVRFAR